MILANPNPFSSPVPSDREFGTAPAVEAAPPRPAAVADLPRVRVVVNGEPLPAADLDALADVRVRQRLGLPALAEVSFRAADVDRLAAAAARVGAALRVEVGGQDAALFDGEVTAVERTFGPPHRRELRLRGYDRLHRLRKRQPVRAHVRVTAADLAREMAGEIGLSVEAAEPGPVRRIVLQAFQSDFDLLVDQAGRAGLYPTLRGTTLHLLTLAGDGGEAIPLELGTTLLEARGEANADAAGRAASAQGWDWLRIERRAGRSGAARSGRAVSIDASPTAFEGVDGDRTWCDRTADDDAQLDALAQADLDRRCAAEVALEGVAEGDARLSPGAAVEVTGLGETFGGRYVVTEVDHRLDGAGGYLSHFGTRPPSPPPGAGVPGTTRMTAGVVTRVDDPENLGRARVALPTFGGLETDWLGVLSAGAGGGKGIVWLPDVDDQVLVLLPGGDPGHGVIVGGLYGVHGPPDAGVEGGAVRRFSWLTPGGQRVRLDDVERSLRLETAGGSVIDLSPKGCRLSAESDLRIEAAGRNVTIRGKRVNFEQG